MQNPLLASSTTTCGEYVWTLEVHLMTVSASDALGGSTFRVRLIGRARATKVDEEKSPSPAGRTIPFRLQFSRYLSKMFLCGLLYFETKLSGESNLVRKERQTRPRKPLNGPEMSVGAE